MPQLLSSLAKLVNITPIKPMVYGRYNKLVHAGYQPTYNWGAPSCGQNPLILCGFQPSFRWCKIALAHPQNKKGDGGSHLDLSPIPSCNPGPRHHKRCAAKAPHDKEPSQPPANCALQIEHMLFIYLPINGWCILYTVVYIYILKYSIFLYII